MELSVFYDHVLEAAHQTDKSTLEILKCCHEFGINGLEMNFSFLDEKKKTVCSELSDSGMKISCIYETFDFGRNKDISEGKRMIEAAAEMKASRILVIPGELESWEAAELSACSDDYDTVEQYMNQSERILNMQYALIELVGYAAKAGIQITLEDFDGFMHPFARINQLLWFMKHVPGLKYTLDMGNFAFSNEDVVKAATVLGEYIVHVHCKDRRKSQYVKGEFCKGLGQCAAGEGYIPIDSLVKCLKASGYNGYLAIEHFGVQNQISYIEKSADYLKRLI